MPSCSHCSRVNPTDALFCYHDGSPLGEAALALARLRRFPNPFVFPSGRSVGSFDELVLACLDDWPVAIDLFRDGTLAAFLSGLDRPDLAFAASQAARFPDSERGLDDLLRQLPSGVLQPARLHVQPTYLDLGQLRVGQDEHTAVLVANHGMGLLHGTITTDVPWLSVGEHEGASSRHFRCLTDTTIPFRIHGKALRAHDRPQVGRLLLDSNGGTTILEVRLFVPALPFAAGVLAGARTPRQLADLARVAVRESVRHFESGAVARWYADNGWTYPVDGEPATGVAAVQQFFDALGLTRAPDVQLSETAITLTASPGEAVQRTLRLSTREKRPIYARAISDQPWLIVRGIDLDGSAADIHLSVPVVPGDVGQTLHAQLTILGNGRQRFTIPVSLQVRADVRVTSGLPEWLPAPIPQVLAPAPLPPPPPPPRIRRRMLAPIGLGILLGVAGLVLALVIPPSREQSAPPPPTAVVCAKSLPVTGEQAPPPDAPEMHRVESPTRPPERDIRPRETEQPRGPRDATVQEFRLRPIEVVFCIDTTGSMGELLLGAKQKVWAMCNQIAGGRPVPELHVGLVAYRDRGDSYVTKLTPLTRDLDRVYAELNALSASGGGDVPESVNQALDEAINQIHWSSDPKTLRIVFLVGDAPPHVDYADDVKYPETCKRAVEKGIFINTIQCGTDPACRRHWVDIAARAKGEYVAIAQTGGVVALTTPMDGPLADLGRQLLDTALVYGTAREKKQGERTLADARRLTGPAAADRTAFVAKSKRLGPPDLLEAVLAKRVTLEDVPVAELPAAMKGMKRLAERREYLDKVATQRQALFEQVLDLEKERAATLQEMQARKGRGKDAFDSKVLEVLRQQAKRFDIAY